MLSFLTSQEWYKRAVSLFSNPVPLDIAPEIDIAVEPTQMLMYCGAISRMNELVAVHRQLRDDLAAMYEPKSLRQLPVLERMKRVGETFDELDRYVEGFSYVLPREILDRYPPPEFRLGLTQIEQELMRELADEMYRQARAPRDETD